MRYLVHSVSRVLFRGNVNSHPFLIIIVFLFGSFETSLLNVRGFSSFNFQLILTFDIFSFMAFNFSNKIG